MNLSKRAFLYVIRKRGKSLLLILIFFIIASLVLFGLASLEAERNKSHELRGTTGAGFTIKAKERWGDSENDGSGNFSNVAETKPLSKKMIEKIMSIDGIKAYNANFPTVLAFYDEDGTPYRNDYNDVDPDSSDYPLNLFQGNSCTNTEYAAWFLNRKIALTEGRHITKSDQNTIIISDKLAKRLGLKLGDKISAVINPQEDDPYVTLTIVGLFEVLADEEDPQNSLDSMTLNDLYGGYSYNWFTDMKSMETLNKNYSDGKDSLEESCNLTDFYVNDPKNLERIMQAVQDIKGIDWDDYELIANDEVYERAGDSMSKISSLIRTLMIIIVAISMCIVTLLLTLWVRSRMHETGILLAAGITKISILLQYILEIMLLALCSIPLAYVCSRWIAEGIGRMLGETGVIVTTQHLALVCSFGIPLLIAAVLLSSIPMMRLSPKEILTKTN